MKDMSEAASERRAIELLVPAAPGCAELPLSADRIPPAEVQVRGKFAAGCSKMLSQQNV